MARRVSRNTCRPNQCSWRCKGAITASGMHQEGGPMLRPADLVNFLVTIRNAIAQDLRPDLKSDHVRGEAGALLLILDRLIAELRSGNAVAAERLEAWSAI